MLRRMISCGALERCCAGTAEAVAALPAAVAPATIAPTPRIVARIIWVCAPRQLLAQLCQMAAGDMAGLVREHADDLVRRLRFHQRAGIDEDAAAVDDEGVEAARSLMMTTWMFCCARPAARRIGAV